MDGDFVSSSGLGGVGALFRDHSGDIVGGFCAPLSFVASAEIEEAMAARMACSFSLGSINLGNLCLEVAHRETN